MKQENRWYDKMNLIIIVIPVLFGMIGVVGTLYTAIYRLNEQDCRIKNIEEYGSPTAISLKKDVRWIMKNIAQKWNLVIPEDRPN